MKIAVSQYIALINNALTQPTGCLKVFQLNILGLLDKEYGELCYPSYASIIKATTVSELKEVSAYMTITYGITLNIYDISGAMEITPGTQYKECKPMEVEDGSK